MSRDDDLLADLGDGELALMLTGVQERDVVGVQLRIGEALTGRDDLQPSRSPSAATGRRGSWSGRAC